MMLFKFKLFQMIWILRGCMKEENGGLENVLREIVLY